VDLLTQSSFILSAVSFAFGATVLTRNVRNKLFIAFSLCAATLSFWSLCFFLDSILGPGAFYRWHLFFHCWLAPASLTLIQIFSRAQDLVTYRIRDLAVFLAISGSFAVFLDLDEIPWVATAISLMPFLVGIQLIHQIWIGRRIRFGLKFGRRNFVYWGALIAQLFATMDHFHFLGRGFPAAGNILLAIYLYFLSQAVLQQRLLNFGALLSQFLVLVVFALSMTALYAVLVSWVADRPSLFLLNSFIASFLLLTLLDPIRALTRYFTERLLTQQHLRLQGVLVESQRKLAGVVDPGALFQNIIQTTEQILQPQWMGFFLLRSDGTKYRRVRSIGEETTSPLKEILVENPILEHARMSKRRGDLPILLDQVFESEIDRATSATQKQRWTALIQGLRALGGNLLIPLIDQGTILGFLILRAPQPPEPWGNNWGLLSVIYPFYEQATQTLRNLEVYVRQREKERLATLGEMAAGLAHEIRNPLGAIKGAAQYLDPSKDRPESAFLKVIVEETDRLNRVVTQFLDYSKPSHYGFQKIDLGVLVQKTIENARPGISNQIKIDLQIPSHPVWINGVTEQLQQVMLNFIQNACRAVEGTANPLIEVGMTVAPSSGNIREVVLTVEDNGAGIKKENLDKIFIPFFTTSQSGTGLGLPISQKIIESHQGRIDVASEESQFTRFTVTLPCIGVEES